MNVRAMRDEFGGVLRSAVSMVALLATLLLMSSAARAVVDPTPTPKTPPHTDTDAATTKVSSAQRLDGAGREAQQLAVAQQAAGERPAVAHDVSTLQGRRDR